MLGTSMYNGVITIPYVKRSEDHIEFGSNLILQMGINKYL